MISPQVATEKLLQVYYNLKGQGVDLDHDRENIFKDDELTHSFCNFLKNYFKMQVPSAELSDKETLGEALDALIPYLPEDTTRLYFNMMTIYCLICEDTDNKLYDSQQQLKMYATSKVAKVCFMGGLLLGIICLMVCARGTNADSVLAAYNQFEQMKPFSWLSSGAFFYFCVVLIPLGFAFFLRFLGGMFYKLYQYFINIKNKQL